MAISLPTAAQAALQTPLNTYSPTSNPLTNTTNGYTYTYDTGLGVWTVQGAGGAAVTSFAGGTTGLTPAAATSGPVTLGGTLAVANGGTGATTGAGALAGLGMSVNASGGTTGLTFSGGPVTSSGTLTMAGTLAVANGGTGGTTQSAAINNLLPAQGGNAGKSLKTDGTNVSWGASSGAAAWVAYDSVSGVFLAGNNVSSVTKTATGVCTISFATPLASANYSGVTGFGQIPSFVAGWSQPYLYGGNVLTAGSYQQVTSGYNGSWINFDCTYNTAIVNI